tara:strand:+ start:8297 stop:8890 length:594 start_codon:yes stop_codon:yes gene_type:complete
MLKRFLDVIFSVWGILIFSPLFIIIALSIKLTSKGPIFYKQKRVGLNGIEFSILKFRTMKIGSDKSGLLTVGNRDNRITTVGYYLRKFKLDELPQLFNVFCGEMSLVGPRPEVQKYVDLYSDEDLIVLSVKPGITDYASIYFRNENEILKNSDNPEMEYINVIMPKKLNLNKKYIEEKNVITDLKIIYNTIKVIIVK